MEPVRGDDGRVSLRLTIESIESLAKLTDDEICNMGFYFRKSVGFGPFRLNFSKSGIGVSAGVKGARISAGPRGTYVHAGRNGFYYSQRIGGDKRVPSQNPPPRGPFYERPVPPENFVIETADVSQLTETSITELLQQINEKSAQPRFAPWAIALTFVCAIVGGVIASAAATALAELGNAEADSAKGIAGLAALLVIIIIGTAGGILSWRIHKGDELKRTTPLFYELEQDVAAKFEKVQNACSELSRAAQIWRVRTNQPTWDWKRNAGASSLITRHPVNVGRMQPPYIATNVAVWTIRLNDMDIFFLPDYAFLRQQGKYGALSYESLIVTASLTRFIEDCAVPPDALIVGYTWQFVNKNGGPDRRFSNNRQLAIAQYAFLQFQSSSGLNVHLQVSSISAANAFTGPFVKRHSQSRRTTRAYEHASFVEDTPFIDPKLKAAFSILGLTSSASAEEIVSAYRSMAKMYHPDRLANLAPEFIELAEARMKEINAAYEMLKRRKT